MLKYYVDAGTSWSKILEVYENPGDLISSTLNGHAPIKINESSRIFVVPSRLLSSYNLQFKDATGHMAKDMLEEGGKYENEILALAYGSKKIIKNLNNATIIDIGSRDTKWIRFEDAKYKDLNWNGSCGSSTGATIEMICKFYDVNPSKISSTDEKYPVTCGVFAMEKIMDDIAKDRNPEEAIAKYIHGIAFNTWNFAQKPDKLYLSGGFCENRCFIESLKKYCEIETLGRFVLLEGLL